MPIIVGNGIEIGNGITITSGPGGGGVVTDNLVLQLRPNSYPGSGTLWDNTVLAYPGLQGTLNNNPTYNPTTGFTFTQVSSPYQSVTIPHQSVINFNSSTNYTVEVWFKAQGVQVTSTTFLATKNNYGGTGATLKTPISVTYNNIGLAAYDVAFTTWSQSNGGIGARVNVTDDAWFQVVGVYNWTSGSLLPYKNGIQTGTVGDLSAIAGSNITSTTPITLALGPNTIGALVQEFKGDIGIFRIYSKALTSGEVLQNFEADRSIFGI